MPAEIVLAKSVQLVLLAMFQPVEKAVAKCDFTGNPCIGLRIAGAPATDQVDVTIISCELDEAIEALPGNVGCGEIDGVISLAHIECAAVDRNAVDGQRDQEVGVGVPVSVSIGGQVIREEEIADLEKLRDGLTVVSGNPGGEILRGLYAS